MPRPRWLEGGLGSCRLPRELKIGCDLAHIQNMRAKNTTTLTSRQLDRAKGRLCPASLSCSPRGRTHGTPTTCHLTAHGTPTTHLAPTTHRAVGISAAQPQGGKKPQRVTEQPQSQSPTESTTMSSEPASKRHRAAAKAKAKGPTTSKFPTSPGRAMESVRSHNKPRQV